MKPIITALSAYTLTLLFLSLSAHGRGLDGVVQEAKSNVAPAQTPAPSLPGFETNPETAPTTMTSPDPSQPQTLKNTEPKIKKPENVVAEPTKPKVDVKKEAAELNDPETDLSVHTSFGIHRIMRSKVSGELYSGGAASLAIGWVLRDDERYHLLAIGRYQPVAVTGQISGVEVEGTLHHYWFGVEQKRPIFGMRFNHSLELGISQMQMISVDDAEKTPDAAKKMGVLIAYQAGSEHFISGKRLSVGWNARVAGFQTQSFAFNFVTKWYL